MKINLFIQKPIQSTNFKGVREDRNTVAQLKQDNDYSLNEPNQRRINKAIDALAKQKGEENIKFLLDVGENIKYQTNIQNGKVTKNEWKTKLKNAAEESLYNSNPILKQKYQPEIDRVFSDKTMSKDDKYLFGMKSKILKKVDDKKEYENIDKNLDYFITSTETPIKQKKYILKRLDYFMSPNYEINPQLKDKKSQVLSEMVNDITINTPESKIPNIKSINQKTHGMCAAISIVRKAIAYEDKPNYVDAILSELDSSDKVMVYDRQNLGSGKRVPVKKAPIDFQYAMDKGYRIVDASTLQWMNIAGMYGNQNESMTEFNAFDKHNFDAFHDSHFTRNIDDDELMRKQSYFQALTKAKDTIVDAKSAKIKSDIASNQRKELYHANIDLLSKKNEQFTNVIKEILPNESKELIQDVKKDLLNLQKPISEDIKKNDKYIQKYSYIPNEEYSQKLKKVQNYFLENYADKIDSKSLKAKTESVVSYISEINKIDNDINHSVSMPGKIRHARQMYETEASYRAKFTVGFMEPETLNSYLITNKIPDKESRIVKGFDTVIDRIEKKNDQKLINHFAQYLEIPAENKSEIVEKLKQAKNSIEIISTDGFDSLYHMLGYKDRRDYIMGDIADSKASIINGDKHELGRAAACIGVKEDKAVVVKELEKLEKKLKNNPTDEKAYLEAINKMGYKDQSVMFVSIFKSFVDSISEDSEDRDFFIDRFCEANGISRESSIEEINNVIVGIQQEFNTLSNAISTAEQMLYVPGEETPYFSVSAPHVLIKKLENEGTLVPAKTMRKLQDRFTKIDKIRSSDEFSSRQGKISQPELYQMTKEEKDAIKQIDKKLNKMYSDVNTSLIAEYRDMKEPLKKLANYVGTNMGVYWVTKDGQSGLFTPQEVKVFEQVTGRPYYSTEDIEKAVDVIKNGVHSGTSSSSVFHDRLGGHAMYVADIKPVNGKDVLFHDNTWGPSEHENTWVDSEGLTRTDYSDRRGGELGYITDEDWRNGNYVDNLLYKKGHIVPDDTQSKIYKKLNPSGREDYDFNIMCDMILCGADENYKTIAGGLKDAIYIPDSIHVPKLEKMAEGMTKLQIEKAIFRVQNAGTSYKNNYEKIMKRINADAFNKGINTKEDFDNLSDTDIVKLAFEKAALRESYPDSPTTVRDLAKVNNVKDLDKIRATQHKQAMENFEYSFGKSKEILLYPGLELKEKLANTLVKPLKDNGIKCDADKLADILRGIAVFKEDENNKFTGRVCDMIDYSVKKASKQFDENRPNSENADKAKEEFLNNLRNVLEENLYFNKEDLKLNSDKAQGVRDWVDRKFNPTTDEEFVETYRKIQDMSLEEFRNLTKDVSDKELGINPISGYDVLRKVKAANDDAQSLLKNTLFFDEYSKDMSLSKTKPAYKYKKTERKLNGAYYQGSRTFDDLYRNMYFALSTLEYPKMFAKYESEAFRKHGVFPAYPKVDLMGDGTIEYKMNSTEKIINETLEKINAQKTCIFDYQLVHKIDDYRNSIDPNKPLSKMERDTLTTMVGQFISDNMQDPDMEDTLAGAYKIMEMDKGATINDFKDEIDTLVNTTNAIEKINSEEVLKEAISAESDGIKGYIDNHVKLNIAPRYRRTVKEDLNNLIKLEYAWKQNNGLDNNKELLSLQSKISDASINPDDKIQTDKFVRLMTYVNKAKMMKSADKVDSEKLANQIDKINDYADKYVDRFIEPDKKNYIKANINDWLSKELISPKKNKDNLGYELENARQKYRADFVKYNLLSNPVDLLNEFLLANASDAKKDDYTKFYGKTLQSELELSKLIEIQDLLMEAVGTGNAAQVKDYFDEYYVTPYNGDDVVSMNSDSSIDWMVRSLIVEDNTKTAKMFVEKLGLGDRVMKIEQNILKDLNPKEKIDEVAGILQKTGKYTTIFTDEYKRINNELSETDDVNKTLTLAKKRIIQKAKEVGAQKEVKPYLDALDEAKEMILENPDLPKSVIFTQKTNDALVQIQDSINKQIKENQDYLNVINLFYDFLIDLHLPEYSKGYKIQQEIQNDYKLLKQYNQDVMMKTQEVAGDIMATV